MHQQEWKDNWGILQNEDFGRQGYNGHNKETNWDKTNCDFNHDGWWKEWWQIWLLYAMQWEWEPLNLSALFWFYCREPVIVPYVRSTPIKERESGKPLNRPYWYFYSLEYRFRRDVVIGRACEWTAHVGYISSIICMVLAFDLFSLSIFWHGRTFSELSRWNQRTSTVRWRTKDRPVGFNRYRKNRGKI